MTTLVLEKAEPDYDLRAVDRCDRCGSQAYIVAYIKDRRDETTLLFCNHHAKNAKTPNGISHIEALDAQGFIVLDYSERLTPEPVDEDYED